MMMMMTKTNEEGIDDTMNNNNTNNTTNNNPMLKITASPTVIAALAAAQITFILNVCFCRIMIQLLPTNSTTCSNNTNDHNIRHNVEESQC
jgi:hypothetical protein